MGGRGDMTLLAPIGSRLTIRQSQTALVLKVL
jgi:hypothetical protein